MTPPRRARRPISRIVRAEADLAARVASGDRIAFDVLFDCYLLRMAHVFRALPEPEARAKIWETLEQVFAGLACASATPLAVRAFLVAKRTQAGRAPHSVRAPTTRTDVSRHER